MSAIPIDSYVLIIGAYKCGTSSMYMHLTQHEAICACKVKEPEFFSENQGHGDKVKQYSDLWDYRPETHRYALEASTGYTKFPYEPNVARNIKNSGINPTFIYIVRDPLKRIESDYNFSMNKDWFDPKVPITDSRYVDFSDYFLQLEQYQREFGTTKIWLYDFDEMVRDAEVFTNSIFRRLGLPGMQLPTAGSMKNKTPDATQGEVFVGTHRRIRSTLKVLPAPLKNAIRYAYRPFQKTVPRRELTEAERSVIFDKLAPSMQKFNRQYGFPVKQWGF